MSLKVVTQGGVTILRLKGEFLGGKETDELESRIKELSHAGNGKLIINLSKVTYMNACALSALIKTHRDYAKRDARVRVCDVGDKLHHLFEICGAMGVFAGDTWLTEEEALASLVA